MSQSRDFGHALVYQRARLIVTVLYTEKVLRQATLGTKICPPEVCVIVTTGYQLHDATGACSTRHLFVSNRLPPDKLTYHETRSKVRQIAAILSNKLNLPLHCLPHTFRKDLVCFVGTILFYNQGGFLLAMVKDEKNVLWRRRVWGRWGRQFGPIRNLLAAPAGIPTACDFPASRLRSPKDKTSRYDHTVSVCVFSEFRNKPWSFPKYWSS